MRGSVDVVLIARSLVGQQCVELVTFQFASSAEESELQQKGEPDDPPPEPLREPDGRGGGAPGREHVVAHEDTLPRGHGVTVDLEEVGAVLELVLLALDLPRELSGLAHGHEPGPEPPGQWG